MEFIEIHFCCVTRRKLQYLSWTIFQPYIQIPNTVASFDFHSVYFVGTFFHFLLRHVCLPLKSTLLWQKALSMKVCSIKYVQMLQIQTLCISAHCALCVIKVIIFKSLSESFFGPEYGIVASTSPSRIEVHTGIFRSLMKGIFDPQVL